MNNMLKDILNCCGVLISLGFALKVIEFIGHSFLSFQNAIFEYSSILYVFICVLIVVIWLFLIFFFGFIFEEEFIRLYKEIVHLNGRQNAESAHLVELLSISECLNLQADDEVDKLKSEISQYKKKKKNISTMTTSLKHLDYQLMNVQLSSEKSRESLECPLCFEQVSF